MSLVSSSVRMDEIMFGSSEEIVGRFFNNPYIRCSHDTLCNIYEFFICVIFSAFTITFFAVFIMFYCWVTIKKKCSGVTYPRLLLRCRRNLTMLKAILSFCYFTAVHRYVGTPKIKFLDNKEIILCYK